MYLSDVHMSQNTVRNLTHECYITTTSSCYLVCNDAEIANKKVIVAPITCKIISMNIHLK